MKKKKVDPNRYYLLPAHVLDEHAEALVGAYVVLTPALLAWAREARAKFLALQAWDPSLYALEVFNGDVTYLDDCEDRALAEEAQETLDEVGVVRLAAPLKEADYTASRTECATVLVRDDGLMWTASLKHGGGVETGLLSWKELEARG